MPSLPVEFDSVVCCTDGQSSIKEDSSPSKALEVQLRREAIHRPWATFTKATDFQISPQRVPRCSQRRNSRPQNLDFEFLLPTVFLSGCLPISNPKVVARACRFRPTSPIFIRRNSISMKSPV